MGFSFNGLSGAAVTISGSLTTTPASSGSTNVMGCYQKAATTADTAYTIKTPTVSKTLYITSLTVCTNGTALLRIGDNISGNAYQADTAFNNCLIFDASAAASPLTETFVFPVPMSVATALKLISSGTSTVEITWSGYEV